MQPKEVIQAWVEAFNRADARSLSALYAENAVNHQAPESPIEGRDAIKRMFESEFERAEMVCTIENLFQDGDWVPHIFNGLDLKDAFTLASDAIRESTPISIR